MAHLEPLRRGLKRKNDDIYLDNFRQDKRYMSSMMAQAMIDMRIDNGEDLDSSMLLHALRPTESARSSMAPSSTGFLSFGGFAQSRATGDSSLVSSAASSAAGELPAPRRSHSHSISSGDVDATSSPFGRAVAFEPRGLDPTESPRGDAPASSVDPQATTPRLVGQCDPSTHRRTIAQTPPPPRRQRSHDDVVAAAHERAAPASVRAFVRARALSGPEPPERISAEPTLALQDADETPSSHARQSSS